MPGRAAMYHSIIEYAKTVFVLCFISIMLVKVQYVYSQNDSEKESNIHQKYLFNNDEISISLESNKNFMYENDSCRFDFVIQNLTDKDIYIIDGPASFGLSYCGKFIIKASIDYGGYFTGGIDYIVNMTQMKPKQKIKDHIMLFSREYSKNGRPLDFNVDLCLGYLKSDKIDSIKNWYPEYTNIKTEIINERELITSAYVLYMYLKRLKVGSLLIENR